MDARLPAWRRVKSHADFAAVFARGVVAADDMLVVHALRKSSPESQLGLSVSKKVGHAPRRNHWKRLIRESYRRNIGQIPPHLLLVVRPRRGATPNYHAVESSLIGLTWRVSKRLAKCDDASSGERR